MARYLYRGTSLSSAIEDELGSGIVTGEKIDIYQGRLTEDAAHATVARGTPLSELPWDAPPGAEPYLARDIVVTGGFSEVIGTAIGFSTGVPVVLTISESGLRVTPGRVGYQLAYFDNYEGALARVYGDAADGEVRDTEGRLVGLTSMGANGPAIVRWGRGDLKHTSREYSDERELIVNQSSVSVTGAIEAVTIMLEGRRTARQALANFEGYHAGWGDGEDTTRLSDKRVLETLHDEVRSRAGGVPADLWTISLTTNVQEKVDRVTDTMFEYAYGPDGFVDAIDAVPAYLLGDV